MSATLVYPESDREIFSPTAVQDTIVQNAANLLPGYDVLEDTLELVQQIIGTLMLYILNHKSFNQIKYYTCTHLSLQYVQYIFF